MITDKFIKTWETKYDSETDDELAYAELVKQLRKETLRGHICFSTIVKAVEWKTPRIKGCMDFRRPDMYCAFVQLAHDSNDKKVKLWLLTSLNGWGIPMASTMLHLIHPNRFPIVDYRVLKVLRDKNNFTANRDTEKGYWLYYDEIHGIMKSTGYSIRIIDRALWTYHRVNYQSVKKR